MDADQVAPCRHAGVAPEEVVQRTIEAIENLAVASQYLGAHGLSATEYISALPIAIQRMRGSAAADNSNRRQYLKNIFTAMLERGLITALEQPKYGNDTVYRLSVPGVGEVATIQKGCPDGRHSSTAWEVPVWAVETYLWWLCPSLNYSPGVHINKGINRIMHRYSATSVTSVPMLDGVIFNNDVCGTAKRPCPKSNLAISIAGATVTPPCVYVLPRPNAAEVKRELVFPSFLLALFNIAPNEVADYTGQVVFYPNASKLAKKTSLRFGVGKSTIYRG